MDVTNLHAYTKQRGLSFYYALVYLATNAVNAVENFRYTMRDGEVYLLDERIPSFTDLKPGSEDFHIVTLPQEETLEQFCAAAKARSADVVLIDTAGRLHNKQNLMNELNKISRVVDRELPGCARAYRVRYNQAHGILEAAATTAVAMTEQQAKSLHEKLEKLTGKTIDLKTKVDPAVLGGIRLDIEGTELDGTVQNRLSALRRDIASVTL